MESQYFILDGIKSTDMNLHLVRVGQSGGFVETPYWGGADIHESQSRNRVSPYFYGLSGVPIEFTVQFALVDKYGHPKKWTPRERFKIAEWMLGKNYKKFQTSDDLGKTYYVLANSATNLNLMNGEGYIEVTFRTNSPFAWSPIYIDSFDLSSNTGSKIIELENRSNVVDRYYPLIEIELIGETRHLKLKNLSNKGQAMEFKNLVKGETIGIDCENKIIKSNVPDSNPFSKFNVDKKRYWLDLVRGINRIEVTGAIVLHVKSIFPIAQ